MARIIALAGSPSTPSRSSGLLDHAIQSLHRRGISVERYSLDSFEPDDILYARFASPAIVQFQQAVLGADALLLATPVYKAAYSGVLKLLLDVLPERALEGKFVVNLATGGTPVHTLAVDHALQPVLSALKVRQVIASIFAVDRDLQWRLDGSLDVSGEVSNRLEVALNALQAVLPQNQHAGADALRETIRQGRISV